MGMEYLAYKLLFDTLNVIEKKPDPSGPVKWRRAYNWCFTEECGQYCDVLNFPIELFRRIATEIKNGLRKLQKIPKFCPAGTKQFGAPKRSPPIYLTHWGETKRLDKWQHDPRVNKKYMTLYHRYKKRWSPELILTAPLSNTLRVDTETMTITRQ